MNHFHISRLIATAVVLSVLAGGMLFAHDIPYAFSGHPLPRPTVDPGPDAALLRVRIVDAGSGETIPATVSVNDGNQEPDVNPLGTLGLRQGGLGAGRYSFDTKMGEVNPLGTLGLRYRADRRKGPIRWREIPYYFFTDGRFEVRVPPGPVSIQVGKGYEYRPVETTLRVGRKETADVEIPIERALDMAALGWYSGDTHIHLERTGKNDDMILAFTAAKDIRYAHILSFNTKGYDPKGVGYESSRQHVGLGERSTARRGPYHITSGHEYRPATLGHVTLIMPDDYVPANGFTNDAGLGPSLAVIADQTRALRGFFGFAHGGYPDQEADKVALEGKMDFLELLQFGEYRRLGVTGWYDFLNIGFRLAMSGASDYPGTRELASEMTYVWSDTVPTVRSFMEGLVAGRSFATSGPMLFLTVDGHKPGTILRHPAGSKLKLTADVVVRSPQFPVRYLDLIVNGEVVERRFDENGRSEWSLRHVFPVDASSWIAARAYNDAGTEAHTNPIYVYIGNKLPFQAASARQIIARLEGSMDAIPIPAIVARIGELKGELQNLIERRPSALPLPGTER